MDIYAQSTDFNVNNFYLLIYLFIFAEKKRERNLHSDVLETAFSFCSIFVSGLELVVQWGQRGIQFMLADLKRV